MTALRRGWFVFAILAAISVDTGCRKKDPPPTHYEDLGDEGEALLPTSSAWQDPGVASGQSTWRPFREPRPADEVAAAEEAAPTNEPTEDGDRGSDLQGELRALVREYNDALSGDSFDELPDFFVVDQADGVTELAGTLSTFTARLGELAELMPLEAENHAKLISHLLPAAALKLEIGQITMKGEGQAVATLTRVPALSFLPGMPAAGDIPREARLMLGDDDYWYIESPVVPLLTQVLPFLKQSTGVLDTFIADAGTNGLTSENVQPVADVLKPIIDNMNSGDSGGAENEADPDAPDQPAVAPPETPDAEAADGT